MIHPAGNHEHTSVNNLYMREIEKNTDSSRHSTVFSSCSISRGIKNIFWSIFAAVLLAPFAVAASQHISGSAGKLQVSLDSPLKVTGGLIGLIEALLKLMIQIGTPIAALAIIYSGFLFVAARGNETKLTDAKRTLMYSIIGTAILIGALVIQQVIANTIGQLIT